MTSVSMSTLTMLSPWLLGGIHKLKWSYILLHQLCYPLLRSEIIASTTFILSQVTKLSPNSRYLQRNIRGDFVVIGVPDAICPITWSGHCLTSDMCTSSHFITNLPQWEILSECITQDVLARSHLFQAGVIVILSPCSVLISWQSLSVAIIVSETGFYVLTTPEVLFCIRMIDQAGSVRSGTCAGNPLCDKNLQAVNPRTVTLDLFFQYLLITHCLFNITFSLVLLFYLVAREILQSWTSTICLGQAV